MCIYDMVVSWSFLLREGRRKISNCFMITKLLHMPEMLIDAAKRPRVRWAKQITVPFVISGYYVVLVFL